MSLSSSSPGFSDCRLGSSALPVNQFRSEACAQCLLYIYFITDPFRAIYNTKVCPNGLLICPHDAVDCQCVNSKYVFNIPEFALNSSAVRPLEDLHAKPPLPEVFPYFTRQCCEAAWDCCKTTLQKPRTTECPATWDGWQCFEESKVGTVPGRCPSYIYGDHQRQHNGLASYRRCTTAGWSIEERGKEWTDYGKCRIDEQEATVKLVAGVISFSISVIALVPAVLILTCFRSMRSQSVFVIHRHLLLSFLLSGVSYLLNVFLFVIDDAPGEKLHMANHMFCRLLFVVQLRFFRLATFSWMLAEGVYLWRLLRNAFSDENSLLPYKVACWGGPFVLTVLYATLRQIYDNEYCWILPSVYNFVEWTIMAPGLIAICANLLLVTWILMILVKKLRYNPHLEPVQYRKAVRAALMLVPVFGLHFFFTIYRIPSSAHQIINLVLDGLQGFAVSIILCYTNRSVMECVRKWLNGKRELRKIKEEHQMALKRCESAQSSHKKSLVEAEKPALVGPILVQREESRPLDISTLPTDARLPLVSQF